MLTYSLNKLILSWDLIALESSTHADGWAILAFCHSGVFACIHVLLVYCLIFVKFVMNCVINYLDYGIFLSICQINMNECMNRRAQTFR